MHLQEIIDQLKTDERNAAYTARGIGPIFQIHEEAKILIIGQAPGKRSKNRVFLSMINPAKS